jgi:hypothetical protein
MAKKTFYSLLIASLTLGSAFAQEPESIPTTPEPEIDPIEKFSWETSGQGNIGSFATIDIPGGYRFHKRLFPEAKGERRIETFFNAFFPRHSMRASDLIVRKMTATWNPLILLASEAHHPKNTRHLARLWREATHSRQPKS